MLRRGRFIGPAHRARGRFAVRRSVPPRVRIRSIMDGRVVLDISTRRKRGERLASGARHLLRVLMQATERIRGALARRPRF
jgi:hypothetical protein